MAQTKALALIWLPVNGEDVAHVVQSRELVTMGIVRETARGLSYDATEYTAVHVRRATREEVEQWQVGST